MKTTKATFFIVQIPKYNDKFALANFPVYGYNDLEDTHITYNVEDYHTALAVMDYYYDEFLIILKADPSLIEVNTTKNIDEYKIVAKVASNNKPGYYFYAKFYFYFSKKTVEQNIHELSDFPDEIETYYKNIIVKDIL